MALLRRLFHICLERNYKRKKRSNMYTNDGQFWVYLSSAGLPLVYTNP